MKNLIKIFSMITIVLGMLSCTSQSVIPTGRVSELLNKKEFTFVAQHANPTNMDVIGVMNSMPGGSSSRMLNLDSGYTIELKKEKVTVTLPYFGRMYISSMSPEKNSYRFTSEKFTVTESHGSKGKSVITIVFGDQHQVQKINMEIFSNGKAYVSVASNDRQPISYDGYITENAAVKK